MFLIFIQAPGLLVMLNTSKDVLKTTDIYLLFSLNFMAAFLILLVAVRIRRKMRREKIVVTVTSLFHCLKLSQVVRRILSTA